MPAAGAVSSQQSEPHRGASYSFPRPVSPAKTTSDRAGATIRSDWVEYRNAQGLRISAYFDHAEGGPPARKFAVMAPKYGETKKNNLQLAYELVANGMSVLRFDLTNHIGESEGDMPKFTLPGAVSDIVASIEYLERKHGATDIIVVASSLSARCALRAAVLTPRLSRVVCLVGVVNLQRTICEVYKEDIFGTYVAGRRWGLTDILGFNIEAEHFMQAAIDADLHDGAGTIRDLERLQVPIEYFYAEKDAWVSFEEVNAMFRGRAHCRLHPVPGAMHELRENPKAADRVYRTVVARCLDRDVRSHAVVVPPLQAVLEQNRVERIRLRRFAPSADDEKGFWSEYFDKYKILEHSAVFKDYLELLGRLLGPFRPGMCVLDAGCGNGLFGVWLVRHLARHQRFEGDDLPCTYVGLDLTTRGLSDAAERHTATRTAVFRPASPPPGVMYGLANFDLLGEPGANGCGALPFADNTFDVICCSLVVSYLQRPERLVREFHRVLRPGGTLVMSSLKPHCDLSELYRTFVDQQVEVEELESARNLLRAATTIRLKAEAGHYTFFTEEEMETLAEAGGFVAPETHRSFGNQANVVRALK